MAKECPNKPAKKPALICWNCGEPGHGSADCTQPRDFDKLTRQHGRTTKNLLSIQYGTRPTQCLWHALVVFLLL